MNALSLLRCQLRCLLLALLCASSAFAVDLPKVQWNETKQSVQVVSGKAYARISIPKAQSIPLTVRYTLSGTAENNVDYRMPSLTGTLGIPAGGTAIDLTIPLLDPGQSRGQRTIIATLSAPVGAQLGLTTIHTITLTRTNLVLRHDDDDHDHEQHGAGDPQCPCCVVTTCPGVVVSGPLRFERTTGKPVAITKTITLASVDPQSLYRLILTNGDAQGSHRVDSAEVTVNGQTIISQNQLNEQVASLTRDVTIPANRTLTIVATLQGAPGDFFALELRAFDQRTVAFAQATSAINENGGTLNIPVVLSAVATQPVTVAFSLSGTATRWTDYQLIATSVTIPAGQCQAVIQVPIIDDTLTESDETIVLTLQAEACRPLGAIRTHTATIRDNDRVNVTFNAAASSALESAGTVRIPLTLTQAQCQPLVVNYTVSGTATTGVDHRLANGTVTFASNCTQAFIDVPIIDDTVVENDETVIITLQPCCQFVLGAFPVHTLTIRDNDQVTVRTVGFAQSAATVREDVGAATATLTLSAVASSPVTVTYGISGTATPGSDYQILSGTVTIPAGSQTAAITIPVLDDTLTEPDETVALTLISATGADLTAARTFTLTITDNDPAPVVGFALAASTAVEAAGTVGVSVVLSHASSLATPVTFSVSGTATVGVDHRLLAGTITVPAGATSARIDVPIIDDTVHEPAETVVLSITDAPGPVGGAIRVHTLTITDNDPLPVASFAAAMATVAESETVVNASVVLDRTSTDPVVVTLGRSGTAADGSDVDPVATTVTIPAGALSAPLPVTVHDDQVYEGNESLILTISAVGGGTVGTPSTWTLTITDNEPPLTVAFGRPTTTVAESVGTVAIPVVLSSRSALPVIVALRSGGTVTAAEDYGALPATITIPAGQLEASVPVTVIDDAISEGDETLILTLATPQGAALGDQTSHTLSIRDNDNLPTITFTKAVSTTTESAGSLQVEVRLDHASGIPVSASLALAGTATTTDDYTLAIALSFAPGQTVLQVPIAIVDDQVREPTETIALALTSPVGVSVGLQATHVVSIVDNDPLPSVSFVAAASTASESAGTVAIALKLDRPSATAVTVPVARSGSAVSGVDYAAPAASVTFPAGATTATFNVALIDNAIPQESRIVDLIIADTDDAIASPITAHRLTITDNDTLALTPLPEYLQDNLDGTFTAFFGYRNDLSLALAVPIGIQNRFADNPDQQGQPVGFAVGRTGLWPNCAFSVPFTGPSRTWLLAGRTATVNAATPRPPLAPGRRLTPVPPVVTIQSPSANALVPAGATLRVRVEAYDPDGSLVSVSVSVDGGAAVPAVIVPGSAVAIDLPPLAAGNHVLVASATDDSGLTTTSAAVTVRARSAPTVAINLPSGVPVAGRDLAVAVAAVDPDGTAVAVSLAVDGTVIGTVATAPYAFTLPALVAGPHRLVAVAVDGDGQSAQALTDVIADLPPEVAITWPATGRKIQPDAEGVPLQAVARDIDGVVTSVRFVIDGVTVGTANASPWRVAWTPAPGQRSATVSAIASDERGVTTTSAAVAFLINQPPVVAITAPTDGAVVRRNLPLVVTATATDDDGIADLLIVMNGERLVESFSGSATFTVPTNVAGDRVFRAEALDKQGGYSISAPVHVRIDAPPVVALTAPAANSVFNPGDSVTLTATATDAEGSVAQVEFLIGDIVIATVTTAPYTTTWTAAGSGTIQIGARAVDDQGGAAVAGVAVSVNGAPTVTWAAPAADAILVQGRSVILDATVTDSDGVVTRLDYLVDGQALVARTAAPWTAAWTPTTLGVHVLTATVTDDRGVTSSVTRSVFVDAAPTVAITSPLDGSLAATGMPLSVQIAAADVDGTVAQVTLTANDRVVAILTAAPYVAVLPALTSGTTTLVATATDDRGVSTVSTSVAVIGNGAPTVTLTTPSANQVVDEGVAFVLSAAASDPDDGVAKVEFLVDGALAGSSILAPYAASVTLMPGTHRIAARATDTRGIMAMTDTITVSVNGAPSVAILSPAAGAVVTQGNQVPVTVAAFDREGLARVDLLDGDQLVGQAVAAPWTMTWLANPAGNRSLIAVATDLNGLSARSVAVPVLVNQAPTCAISLAEGASAAYDAEQGLTLVAAPADADGSVANVTFFDGDTALGTVAAAPWSLRWFGAEAKPHVLSAVATDNHGATGRSGTLTITVNSLPTVAITAPATGSAIAAPASVTLTATTEDTDGTIASVVYAQGTTVLGTVTSAPWSLTLPTLPSGTYTVTATATDDKGGSTTSRPVTFTVSGAPNVTLTAPSAGSVLLQGASVALAASASAPAGITVVEFLVDGVVVANDVAAPFTANWLAVTPGAHQLAARATDALGLTATSAATTVTVNAAPVASIAADTSGSDVIVTATASDSDGTIARVELREGTTVLAAFTSAPYSFRWVSPSERRHEVVAVATDDRGAIGTSPVLLITINRTAAVLPVVTLTAPADGARIKADTPIILTATATISSGSISRVEFYDGQTLVGTANAAPYTVTLASPVAGLHGYAALALANTGAGAVSAQAKVRVNQRPTVLWQSPAEGSVVDASASLTLAADAVDGDGTISRVEFRSGATVLGNATTRPYRLTLPGLAAGSYAIRAVAIDDQDDEAATAPVSLIADRAPVVSITAPTAGLMTLPSGALTLTVTATDADGTVARVEFLVDGSVVGTASAAPFTATWSSPTSGSHTITARAVDDRGLSASASVTVDLNAAPQVALTAPAEAAHLLSGDRVSLTALAADSDGTIASVVFLVDGSEVARATASPWQGEWTATPGSHAITVIATDDHGLTATTGPRTVTVNAVPVVAITSPVTGSSVDLGTPITIQVNATDSDGTISLVRVRSGGTIIGTASAAPWTITWTNAPARTHDLVAEAVDDQGATGRSAAVTISVLSVNRPPVVALTAPTAGLTTFAGGIIALAATASDPDGSVASVEFLVDGVVIAAGAQGSGAAGAPYLATWTNPTPGTHQVAARASDGEGLRVTSAPVTVIIRPVAERPSIALTAPVPGTVAVINRVVALAATANVPGGAVARVEFRANGALVGSDTSAPYSVDWLPGAIGFYDLTATVIDDQGGSLATTPLQVGVISDLLQVVITAPGSGATLTTGVATAITAKVFNAIAISAVQFYDGDTRLGSDATEPYAFTWTPTAGAHVLTARAVDYGQTVISAPVNVTVVTDNGLPPTVAFLTPNNNAPDLGLEAITGSVAAGNPAAHITEWTLAWRWADSQRWQQVATGTGPVNGALGKIDTSLLRNGPIVLSLTAFDDRGRGSVIEQSAAISGEAKPGQLRFTVQDLSLPVAGIPLSVLRTYDSLNRDLTGDVGYGWNIELVDMGVKLPETRMPKEDLETEEFFSYRTGGPRDVTIRMPDGRDATFVYQEDFVKNYNEFTWYRGRWVAPPGVNAELRATQSTNRMVFRDVTRNDDGSVKVPVVVEFENSYFQASGPQTSAEHFDFNGWTLSMFDGTVYTFTREDLGEHIVFNGNNSDIYVQAYGKPKVSSVTLPTGERLVIGTDRITQYDAEGIPGKSLAFTRDSQGRVIAIHDPAGQDANGVVTGPAACQYQYNGAGDLVAFKRLQSIPPTGDPIYATTQYRYENTRFAHDLTSIIDPAGNAVRMEYDNDGRLVAMVDSDGKRTLIGHDLNSRTETVFDRNGNQTQHTYDSLGNVVRTVDALGQVTARSYDQQGRVTSETDGLGHTTTYTLDSRGNRLAQVDALGNRTTWTYDGQGNVLTTTDALGRVTTNGYDSKGRLTSVTDAAGNRTTYVHSGSRLLREVDALGNTTWYSYDRSNNVTGVTDALGNVTQFGYDGNGNQTLSAVTRTKADGTVETLTTTSSYDAGGRLLSTTGPDGATTRMGYDVNGRQEWIEDVQGRRTYWRYDTQGRMIRVEYPDTTRESYTYDAEGRRLTATDRAGRVTTWRYDAIGRLAQVILPDGTTSSTAYDAAGRVTATTDAAGSTTAFAYDLINRRTGVTNALNQTTTFAYDAVSNQASITDALNRTTGFAYDVLNRRTTVTYPDARTTQTAYDALGRRTTETDESGKVTTFGYDALGRLVSVTDALGQVTRYAYDEIGNQITQTDAAGRSTRYAYDRAGRRTDRWLPGNQRERMAYSISGLLTSRTDFNNHTTTFAYDTNNRLTTKTPDAATGSPTVSYTYTTIGQRATMTDGTGTTRYAYDVRGRLTSKANAAGTLSYTYSLTGALATITSPAGTTTYGTDVLGRVATVSDPALGATQYAYDAVGNLATQTGANGVTATHGYDSRNRLTSLAHAKGGTGLRSYTYALAPTGHRTGVTEQGGGSIAWTYDSLYRLTGETLANVQGISGAVAYGFDAVGNRTTRASSVAGVPAQSPAYDANDRLTNHTYDANGNTLADATQTYAYDSDDKLISVDGGRVRIAYDGDGTKISETVGGQTTWFLVDHQNPTGYSQTICELNGGLVVRSYVWGLGLAPLAQKGSEGARYAVTDGQGSVRALTDSTGVITDTYAYDAYGILIGRTGTTENRYRYCGYEWMESVGQYYLRARNYDAGDGRFGTRDTYDGDTARPASQNLYAYCENDPSRLDPSGHESLISISSANAIRLGMMAVQTNVGLSLADQLAHGGNAGLVSLGVGTAFAFAPALRGPISVIGRTVLKFSRLARAGVSALSRMVRPISEAVPAGTIITGIDADLAAAARGVRSEPGMFDVVVHGTPNWFLSPGVAQTELYTARQMAEIIELSGWSGEPIRLISCSTGATESSIAQKLANALRAEVHAPTNTVWLHPEGHLTIGPDEVTQAGSWRIFHPE